MFEGGRSIFQRFRGDISEVAGSGKFDEVNAAVLFGKTDHAVAGATHLDSEDTRLHRVLSMRKRASIKISVGATGVRPSSRIKVRRLLMALMYRTDW